MDMKLLQNAIITKDRKSDRMNQNKVISTIADMTQSTQKEAARAYNYCVKKRYLNRLWRQGWVRKVQSTTTKRLRMMTISQRQCHNCVFAALDGQLHLNRHKLDFVELHDHFVGNVDKTCILENEADLYVVGDKKASKSDKNVSDLQVSLMMIHSRTTTNASGPFLFLGSGKNMICCSLSDANMTKQHGVPPHSSFWLNSNGHMTESDWIITTTKLSKGIHAMPM
jgi:hypothetical protein